MKAPALEMKAPALAAAAAAAVVTLAACSQTGATSAAPATVARSAAQVNCSKQYNAWQQGPAKELVAALDTVDSASTAKELAALKKARPAVVAAARYPMPVCADPKGYWNALLMHVNAAAGSAGLASRSPSNMRAALEGVPTIERDLNAELKRTTGAT